MKLKQLEKQLGESLESFRSETLFTVDTFDQQDMKEVVEQMGRQTYYALLEFNKNILEYLKEQERKGGQS